MSLLPNKIKVALFAVKLGLPVADILDAARFILGKSCPYCQLSTNLLRLVDSLGEEKVKEYITKCLNAKKNNDLAALATLQKEIADDNFRFKNRK